MRILANADRARIEHQREHSNLLAGIIAATIGNFAGKVAKQPLSPADFMPKRKLTQAEEQQAIANQMREFFAAKIAKQSAKHESTDNGA